MCPSLRRMSDQISNPQFEKGEEEEGGGEKELNIVGVENPSPENQDSSPANAPEKENVLEGTKNEADDHSVSANEPGKRKIDDDDEDDGFKTPTSLEHRIPAITECPPAPRKPWPPRRRRRLSSSPPPGARRCLELDALGEVESLFRPATPPPDFKSDEDINYDNDNADDEPKQKKARREDDDDKDQLS